MWENMHLGDHKIELKLFFNDNVNEVSAPSSLTCSQADQCSHD